MFLEKLLRYLIGATVSTYIVQLLLLCPDILYRSVALELLKSIVAPVLSKADLSLYY